MSEEFEQWCEAVGLESPSEKSTALLAWNACSRTLNQRIAMLQHELMQTRHELASCETALRDERQERAK